ncbi:MAG: Fe2+-dependent dioxygenase [Gammaproteobacteria bacterium]|nr:Fe2+-dependent dioxygenase [Gammaproteobacteria bacterium]
MFLTIPDLLDADRIARLRADLGRADWSGGLDSTGGAGQGRKSNLQVTADDPQFAHWRKQIAATLWQHPMMRFLVMPRRIMPPVFNRYDTGMYYRDHVDYPLLAGAGMMMRADLSLTIFLSAPDEYEGGDLVIGLRDGERRVKLPAGQAIVYPASTLHRVEPVRSGSRLGIISTVQSRIRGETERALVGDMVALWNRIEAREPDGEDVRLARKIHHNLVRLWAD